MTTDQTAVRALDPTTPVLVGVGQVSERLGEDGYAARSEADLAADAVRAAFADTGVDPTRIAGVVDTLASIRSFEISSPHSAAPFGRPDVMPAAVGARVGITARRLVEEVVGGQSPQHLLTEFAGEIAAGRSEVVVLAGAEVMSTKRHVLSTDGPRPDWSERHDGGAGDHPAGDVTVEDRGYDIVGIVTAQEARHGLREPLLQYSVLENARRARRGETRDAYTRSMAELFAPMSVVAAGNPHAASPVARSVQEISVPTERNRRLTDPYNRLMVARDQVNQSASVVLMSVSRARELGVPQDRWVFLHGHADLVEKPLMHRPRLDASPAAAASVRHALEVAGIGLDDVTHLDLYSCFPIAVSVVCDALGIAADDPRGLTVTGGLPYFGGPGNDYSMHAIAETVHRVRAAPGTFGLVGANGGVLSKYSTGIYATTPTAWRPARTAAVQAALDAAPSISTVERVDGPAVIDSYVVSHRRDGSVSAIVVGRVLDADEPTDTRFIATVENDDETMLRILQETDQPIGTRIWARSFADGNRVSVDAATLDRLRPPPPVGFRDHYTGVALRRQGHVLEVTIDRPEVRNALDATTNAELESVFDAYLADPDLWVAIITGAGDAAFSAGNDLGATTFGGGPNPVPLSGFGGLTARADLTKPVIAALNGHALGGGFEIALACHMVVMDENATVSLPEVKVGLAAVMGGLVRLPRALPRSIAMEMILTGRRMSAAEALDRGIACRVAPAGTVMDVARDLAAEVVACSPTSVRASLIAIAQTEVHADTVAAVRAPTTALDELFVSDDTLEGVVAFVEKRTPEWKGR